MAMTSTITPNSKYTLVSAVAKKLTEDRGWVSLDISNIKLSYLFDNYSKIITVLQNPYLPKNVAFDLDVIREELAGQDISITKFLLEFKPNPLIRGYNLQSVLPKLALLP